MHVDIDLLWNVSPFSALLILWVILLFLLPKWRGPFRPGR